MKTNLRNYVASAFLLLPAAVSLVALPSSALAQPAAPEIRSLEVVADDGLEPGSRLTFRMTATPRVQANIRIRGEGENIELKETQRGVYVGRYVIQRGDRIDRDTELRAVVRQGNRRVTANYDLADTLRRPPVVAVPRIERFGMAPVDRIGPGVELRFALEGVPAGVAVVTLPGVDTNVPLREVRPGHYEGSYTLRRRDDLNPNQPIVASLALGNRVATSNMAVPMTRPGADNRPRNEDNRPPSLTHLVPVEGATVPAGPSVHIAATFEDGRGTGIDPASVQIVVSGRNVTRDAQISRESISFWGSLPPGRHTVDITAKDRAGNVVRKAWNFNVAAAAAAAPVVPARMAVQVLNHLPNAQIGPDPVLVRGRTAPNASVAIDVRATMPQGFPGDPTRTVYRQTLQADNEGIFSFTLVPGTPLPGTRYDISMLASRGSVSEEARMSLFQR